METTLDDRQERFVAEYLIDQNASAAARRCGYSPQAAASQGSALMRMPAVRDRIRMETRGILAALGVTLVDLVKERVKAAYFRNGRMFGEDGRLLKIEDMPRDILEVLEISVVWRGNKPVLRLKQPSRERALGALEQLLERLDRQDEKLFDQRQAKLEEQAARPVLPPRPALFRRDPEPGVGVENDPGFDERHMDLSGPGESGPADTRASTRSARTDGEREIPEKPSDLLGSGDANPEEHQVLSGSQPPSAEKPHHLSPTVPRWDRSKPPGYQLDLRTPEAWAAVEARARAQWDEAMGLGWQKRAAAETPALKPALPGAK